MEAAENGLLTAMQAQSDLTGVTVQLGDPGAQPPAEVVWIAEDAVADWNPDVTMGAMTMDEVYELHVKALVLQPGDDYLTVRDRAAVLAGGVEKACAASRTLGGAVEDSFVIRVARSTGATGVGRGVLFDITLRARTSVGP